MQGRVRRPPLHRLLGWGALPPTHRTRSKANEGAGLIQQEARLERREIRLPNAALLALGRDPILKPLPRGQDRGGEIDLFDGFDYTSLTPEERLVAMLHSYRFVSRGSRLHLSTILLYTKRLKGAPRLLYDTTAEMARQNGLNVADYTQLFTQGFKT